MSSCVSDVAIRGIHSTTTKSGEMKGSKCCLAIQGAAIFENQRLLAPFSVTHARPTAKNQRTSLCTEPMPGRCSRTYHRRIACIRRIGFQPVPNRLEVAHSLVKLGVRTIRLKNHCRIGFRDRQDACPTASFRRAPVKLAATRVRVPPVELDCSRPKAASGKRPQGRTRKHDAV